MSIKNGAGAWRVVTTGLMALACGISWAGTVPEVSVTHITAQTSETSGSPPAAFRFTRTGSTAQELRVYFEATPDSAASNNDWSSEEIRNINGRRGIIFPVGESTYDGQITADQDNMVEGPELLLQSISPEGAYTIAPGSEVVFETTIEDDPPEVSLALDPNSFVEGGAPGAMTLTRSGGDIANELRVRVAFNNGSASPGPDFSIEGVATGTQTLIIIDADELTEVRSVTPNPDNEVEGDETVAFEILPATTSNNNYNIITATDSLVLQDDAAVVRITAPDADASESGDPGVFRISRMGGDPDRELFVYLERSGTASAPGMVQRDYDMDLFQSSSGLFILMDAQESSFDVLVEPLSDTDDGEGDETVVLTIREDIGDYLVIAAQQSATVTIENVQDLVFSDSFR